MDDHQKRLRFRELLSGSRGVIAPSVPEPMFARLVQDCGYPLMHLAGNGMHRSMMLADQSLVTMTEMALRAASIAEVLDIPLLVDGETGYGGPVQTARATRLFEKAGAAGIRLEDSLFGLNGIHRMGVDGITPVEEMCDKIKAVVDTRTDQDLILVIRCDALPIETLEQMRDRCAAYREAGADAVGVTVHEKSEAVWVGANVPKPLVNPWPRAGVRNTNDLFALGYQVALMTTMVHLAALAAARTMLLELAKSGTTDNYFEGQPDVASVRKWYEALGFRTPEPFAEPAVP